MEEGGDQAGQEVEPAGDEVEVANGGNVDDAAQSSSSENSFSEQEYSSSDSGKGGSSRSGESISAPESVESGVAEFECPFSPFPYGPAVPYTAELAKVCPKYPMFYEFDIPPSLVGRLIGRYGTFVNKIKSLSGANVLVKRHSKTNSLRTCAVEGSHDEIMHGLKMIRERFPFRKFTSITLEQSNFGDPVVPVSFIPAHNKLTLIEGVINDVAVSHVSDLKRIPVQHPTHPTFSALPRLQEALNMYSTEDFGAPKLLRPFKAGLICVVPLHDNWYRAEVHAVYEDQDEALIRLVDIGGFYKVGIDTLRQIRVDFATIPFQATDCRLANVIPINEEEGWSEEAVTFFRIISEGSSLQSTVVGHSHVDEISLVHLYKFAKDHTRIFINKELVNHRYAKWIEDAEIKPPPVKELEEINPSKETDDSAAMPPSALQESEHNLATVILV